MARRDVVLGQVPVAAIVVRPDAADPGDDAILLACRASLAGWRDSTIVCGTIRWERTHRRNDAS